MKKQKYDPMINLKVARIKKGLSQKELGGLLGISQNSISLYELGKRSPRKSMLDRFAKALECEVKDLI